MGCLFNGAGTPIYFNSMAVFKPVARFLYLQCSMLSDFKKLDIFGIFLKIIFVVNNGIIGKKKEK